METFVYHEKQVRACCGRHAVNNLLQGYVWHDDRLAELAMSLFEKEKELRLANSDGPHDASYLEFLADGNPYVDDQGNFSVQVVERALEGSGLALVRSKKLIENLGDFPAYILNRQDHWLSIRKVYDSHNVGHWIDLNSFHKIPEHISDFYLSVMLAQMIEDGCAFCATISHPHRPRFHDLLTHHHPHPS